MNISMRYLDSSALFQLVYSPSILFLSKKITTVAAFALGLLALSFAVLIHKKMQIKLLKLPSSIDIFLRGSAIAHWFKREDLALAFLQSAHSLKPHNTIVLRQLAESLFICGKEKEAEAHFKIL